MNYQPKTVAEMRCYLQGRANVVQAGLDSEAYGIPTVHNIAHKVRAAQLETLNEVIAMCQEIEDESVRLAQGIDFIRRRSPVSLYASEDVGFEVDLPITKDTFTNKR